MESSKFPKRVVFASALLWSMFSGQAMAAAPANAFSTPADLVDVYLTGSAFPQHVLDAMAASLFGMNSPGQFNNYHVFFDNGVSGSAVGSSYRAYYGRLASSIQVTTGDFAGMTLSANTHVRFTHRALGGSIYGVNPVARSQAVAWMPLTSANCTAATGQPYNYVCGQAGSDTSHTGRIPDFGVSTMEPRVFKQPINLTAGETELNASELGDLGEYVVSAHLNGIAATNSLPVSVSLERPTVATILAQFIQDWRGLDPLMTGRTQVVICRRAQGSGTQVAFNTYFGNSLCSDASIISGSVSPGRMNDSAGFALNGNTITVNPDAGYTIVENSTPADVRNCLEKAQVGGLHTFSYRMDDGTTKTVNVNFAPGGGYRAIGLLSLENIPNADWSFRDLAGVSPIKANMRTGRYDFFSELTMQYRRSGYVTFNPTALTSGFVTGVPAAGSIDRNRRAFIDLFILYAGDPAILNQIVDAQARSSVAASPIIFPVGEETPEQRNTAYVTHGGNSCFPVIRIPFSY